MGNLVASQLWRYIEPVIAGKDAKGALSRVVERGLRSVVIELCDESPEVVSPEHVMGVLAFVKVPEPVSSRVWDLAGMFLPQELLGTNSSEQVFTADLAELIRELEAAGLDPTTLGVDIVELLHRLPSAVWLGLQQEAVRSGSPLADLNSVLNFKSLHEVIGRVAQRQFEVLQELRRLHGAAKGGVILPQDDTVTFPLLIDMDTIIGPSVAVLHHLHRESVEAFPLDDALFVLDYLLPVCRTMELPEWVFFGAHLAAITIGESEGGRAFAAHRPQILEFLAQFAGISIVCSFWEFGLELANPPVNLLGGPEAQTVSFIERCDQLNKSQRGGRTTSPVMAALSAMTLVLTGGGNDSSALKSACIAAVTRGWEMAAVSAELS